MYKIIVIRAMSFINIFVIIGREVLEVTALLFLLSNALEKIPGSRKYIGLGCLFGILQALLLFSFSSMLILNIFESYDVIINFISGFIMLYTAFWINDQIKYKRFESEVEGNSKAVYYNYYIIFFVGTAVMREVLEILIFTSGVASLYNMDLGTVLLYSVIAIISNAAIGIAGYIFFFKKLIKIIFRVSYYWMILFAANLIASAFEKLNSLGFIDVLSFKIWDMSSILSNNSFLGEVLNVIIGYNAIPTALSVIVYIFILVFAYINIYSTTNR